MSDIDARKAAEIDEAYAELAALRAEHDDLDYHADSTYRWTCGYDPSAVSETDERVR